MSKLKQMQLEDSDLTGAYGQYKMKDAKRAIKIAIIGVSGDIGSKAAENLMELAEKTKQHLHLVLYSRQTEDDKKHGSNKAEGKTRDLKSKYGLNGNPYVTLKSSADYKDLEGTEAVIFSAGTRAGKANASTREELLPFNIGITTEAADNIKHYSPNAFVFVVPNPVDMITWVMQELTGFKPEKVVGLGTSIDTARFRVHLQDELNDHHGIANARIEAAIVGYHNKQGMILSTNSIRINGLTPEEFAHHGVIKKENLDTAISNAYQHTLNEGFEVVKLMGGHGPSLFPAMIAAQAVLAYTSHSFDMEPVPLSIVEDGVCQSRLLKITKGGIQLRDPNLTESEEKRRTEQMSKFTAERAEIGDLRETGAAAQKFDKERNAELAKLRAQTEALAQLAYGLHKSRSNPLNLSADHSSGSSSLPSSHAQRIALERGLEEEHKIEAKENQVKFIIKVTGPTATKRQELLLETLQAVASAIGVEDLNASIFPNLNMAHIPFKIGDKDVKQQTIQALADHGIRYIPHSVAAEQPHSASPPKTPIAHLAQHDRARSASPLGHVERLRSVTPTGEIKTAGAGGHVR